MAFLNASLQKQLRGIFAGMPRPVVLAVFVESSDGAGKCETCEETRALIEELAAVSEGRVRAEIYDLAGNRELAERYGVDKVPAVIVVGDDMSGHSGIRFFGSPGGYEFATLVEDIRMASTGVTGLSDTTIETLRQFTSPVHVQVFVTPTCPFCPRAVRLAHSMAMASHWVTADAVNVAEFPELAVRYQVYGVPRTIINEAIQIEGAMPEGVFMSHLIPLLPSDTQSPAPMS